MPGCSTSISSSPIELIFGIILVVMMLFRREGLIPATRKTAALSFAAQNVAGVQRGGFTGLERIGRWQSGGGTALEVRGVTVRFGGLTALNKVSFTVPAGGVVAVIGPNGSGKSTLFNVITGLVAAQDGSIRFEGLEILGLRPHDILDRGVARTFQNIRLFPNLTVLENVLIGQHARLSTGPLGAVLRLPRTRAEESRRDTHGARHHRAVRQPPGPARRPDRVRPVLCQPPAGGSGARARHAAAHPAARRADRRHESRPRPWNWPNRSKACTGSA